MPTDFPLHFTRLQDVAVVSVEGADATGFLQAQLSRDLRLVGEDEFGLGAWHSPSGRVWAVFRLLRIEAGWLLVSDRDGLAETVASLSRYVLRDEVRIQEAVELQVAALAGNAERWLSDSGVALGANAGRCTSAFGFEWLRIGAELLHVIGERSALARIGADLPPADADVAIAAEIALGLPSLATPLRDRFVPQMLNLDLLGALDEDKGCYPGQEVIARTRNLGAVKRRMQRFSSLSTRVPAPGAVLVDGRGEAAGEVVRAAASGAGIELLGIVRLAALEGALYCAEDTAAQLRHEPLPYDAAITRPPASDAGTE
ncbi:MAG TPA: hypothetical protein VIV14_10705 [Gammaproteobacteria bacterium]